LTNSLDEHLDLMNLMMMTMMILEDEQQIWNLSELLQKLEMLVARQMKNDIYRIKTYRLTYIFF